MIRISTTVLTATLLSLLAASGLALAHGNVVPQAVATEGLEPLGAEWRTENPYRDSKDHARALEIGSSAYNQNCAACHGLEAKSGGIAPDLRLLDVGVAGDEWFVERVRNGAVDRTRRLCAWPRVASYKGQGDPDSAASFTCVAP